MSVSGSDRVGPSRLPAIRRSAPRLSTFQRIDGAIWGGAIGDALGMPAERLRAEDVRKQYGALHCFYASRRFRLEKGSFTDDTQLSLATAESIIERSGIDPADIAKRFTLLFQSKELRRAGTATKNALSRLMYGISWQQSGLEGAKGNGAMMRIGPVALYCARDVDKMLETILLISQITHRHPEAADAAIAVALVLRNILMDYFDVETFIPQTIVALRPGAVRSRLEALDAFIGQPRTSLQKVFDRFGNSGLATSTLATVFGVVRYSADNPNRAIQRAVLGGGDTDTRASIVGSIVGALHGKDAFLESYFNEVEGRDRLDATSNGLFRLIDSEKDSGPRILV